MIVDYLHIPYSVFFCILNSKEFYIFYDVITLEMYPVPFEKNFSYPPFSDLKQIDMRIKTL